jgi:para-aminobenzoate synthetase / 4-amino-4-deoxychorismate lyase
MISDPVPVNKTNPSALGQAWYPLPNFFRDLAESSAGAVLLETAKFDGQNFRTFLFHHPICVLIADAADRVPQLFEQIDQYVERGLYVAGFVSYECGEQFHNISHSPGRSKPDLPLMRMGIITAPLIFDHRSGRVSGLCPTFPASDKPLDSDTSHIEEFTFQMSNREYAEKIRRIQEYLAAGHSYQVNFTDRFIGRYSGSPMALYRGLLQAQPVSYAAFIDCGAHQVLSLSPELFYRTESGKIIVRPMKGTWPRGVNPEEDDRAAEMLRLDEKNRAEHVMIVDLLRSDIGRVAKHGSVQVDRFMEIERYRTLHQLTSTISGTLDPAHNPSGIFAALFPSGSITGAPKRRTMEIIQELEPCSREVYTGALGWFGPNGSSCFSVAIRTLVTAQNHFTLGAGGGITVDSVAHEEYAECQLKASFLNNLGCRFRLIETMRAGPKGVARLDAHLRRLKSSAVYFDVPYDEGSLRAELARLLGRSGGADSRVRLTLDENGHWDIATTPLDHPVWAGRVVLSSSGTEASDVFLYHKTTNRQRYDEALVEARAGGYDEVLFTNSDRLVTEAAISNIFCLTDGVLLTPSTSSGLLPGVFRQEVLNAFPGARCCAITVQDLLKADRIWLCNSLRGSRPVMSLSDSDGNVLWVGPKDDSSGLYDASTNLRQPTRLGR